MPYPFHSDNSIKASDRPKITGINSEDYVSLWPGLPRSEFTGAGAREKDGQETVVMILCTDVYSTVQYSAEMLRESRRWSHRDKHLGTKLIFKFK